MDRRLRLSRDNTPFREELVFFRNAAGLTLKGITLTRWNEKPFASPQSTPTNQPNQPSSDQPFERSKCVVLCHGMAASSSWGFLPELAHSIMREVSRINCVFRFDFSGCGSSEGVFEFGGYSRLQVDLAAACSLVDTKGFDLDCLIGHSMGANTVLLYAAQNDWQAIPNIVSISSRYRMTRGLPFSAEQMQQLQHSGSFIWRPRSSDPTICDIKVTQHTINERLTLDMDVVSKIKQRCLIAHGTLDTVIPVEDATHLHSKIARSALRTIDGADHNFRSSESCTMLVATVCEWIAGGKPTNHHTCDPLNRSHDFLTPQLTEAL